MTDTLLGWTDTQWALALGFLKKRPKNIAEAYKLKKEYRKKRGIGPIEKPQIYNPKGDERPFDWEGAMIVMAMYPFK